MRVAPDTDLGQVHDGDIAAMAIHDIPPPLGHFEKDAPLLLAGIHARLVGNIVSVVNDDGYLCQQHEIRLRTVMALSALPPSVMDGGTFPSGNGKSKAGSKDTMA